MGEIRTSLEEAKALCAEGNLHEVLKIIEQRRAESNYAWSSLQGLTTSLKGFKEALDEAAATIARQAALPPGKQDRQLVEKEVDHTLHYIHLIKEHIAKLLEEEHIKINE